MSKEKSTVTVTVTVTVITMLILAVIITVFKLQSERTFSLEGKWKTTSFGTSGNSEITADSEYCNLNGLKETYVLKKDGKGYTLETANPLSGETTTYEIRVYDSEHIALKQGSSVIDLHKVGNVSEITCTVPESDTQRSGTTYVTDKEVK